MKASLTHTVSVVLGFLKEYWYLAIGFLVFPLVPVLFRWAGNFLPLKDLVVIFGVIEVLWDATFVATLLAFGLGRWVVNTCYQTFSSLAKFLAPPGKLEVLVGFYVFAVASSVVLSGTWSLVSWALALAPLLSLLVFLWGSLKSPVVLKKRLAGARDSVRQNKCGRRWFYLNRLVAFLQPNLVLAFLVYYRFAYHQWTGLTTWLGNLIILAYVVSDNWSTWSFFQTFRLLVAGGRARPKEVYKVFPASSHTAYGFSSYPRLAAELRRLDTEVWPENQRAAPGSIETRVVTSPETTFVLVRRCGEEPWQVVGVLFGRAINSQSWFGGKHLVTIGRLPVYRFGWHEIENKGDFTPEPNADRVWVVGLFVRPGLRRNVSGLLTAELGKYVNQQGLLWVGGGSRIPGVKRYHEKHPESSLEKSLVDYALWRRADGWPVDPVLRSLIKDGSVCISKKVHPQLLKVVGVVVDYFDDPDSLNAAALVFYKDPGRFFPRWLRPLSSRLVRAALAL